MRTAGELADYLATIPRDTKVIIRKDPEGNINSPLAKAGEAMYVAHTTWAGEVYPTPEDQARPDEGWTAADTAPSGAERVIALGPVS
jgi:hypothetical protein